MKLLILSKRKGLAPLSEELERPLMEILWTKGPLMGRDLYSEIRREKDIAYTTALTVLDRLSKKGFIKKDRDSGRIVFSPKISREDYTGTVTGGLVQRAFEMSPDLAVSAFAELFSRMPRGDIDKFEQLIAEKKNGKHT
ncbi:MAG: BlaI/MecI/CopY family transcriptional regulator [Candidatus Aminicenantales bacterium]